MPIDPSIALSYKPIQIADPLAQYGQVQNILASQSQLRSAETQQQVSQMQLAQMRRDEATLKQIQDKAVQNGGPSDLNRIAEAYLNSGNPKFVEFGVGLRQKLDEQAQFARIMGLGSTPAPAMPSVASAPGALGSGTFDPNALVSAPIPTQTQRFAGSMGTNLPPVGATNQLAPAPAAPAAPVNRLAPGVDVSALRRKRDALLAMGTNQSIAAAKAIDADIALASKEPAYQNVTGVGLVDPRDGRVIVPSVESTDPVVKQYEYAKNQGFVGTLFEFKRKLAEATRAPVQPVAPTITQIVDPANPNQMISVDARRYKGGGVGSPGVIGIGGKEPGAALRINKVEQGKTQLADDLENLRASFETLNNLRAVPSTERGPLSNVASAVASSRVGQLTGQAFATEAQVERDVINSARSRLVNSIKNATGMSAQQLNSNVELQTMLKSISDPGQSYQSAIRIIQDIEDAYVTGSGMSPKKDKPAPPATQGTGGFRYLGKESN
jgi:hypothetical protein